MQPYRHTRHLASLLLLLALLAACASPAAPGTSAPSPSVSAAPRAAELTVFAAASLKDSFTELGKRFEAANPGARVVFNFAGSQQLRAQLEQGAPADVFASANQKEMDAAIKASLVASGAQQTFARNRLVVIYPKANPGQVTALADLAKPGLKLVIADKAVPVGQYTLDVLDRMNQDAAYGADFSANAQKNVVSFEQDVKAVVTKVRLGEADAGIVYSTDAAAARGAVTALQIPDPLNQLATYPIAALTRAPHRDLAQKFVDLVLSDEGQRVLGSFGFVAPAAP